MVFKVVLCRVKSSEGGPGLVKEKPLSHVRMLLNSRQVESK